MKYTNSYLVYIEFLGFRYHGWAKQTGFKTVHQMIDKTLEFVFKQNDFKTIGGSRTDAMVSASTFIFQLFTNHDVEKDFLQSFNQNLPPDIRAEKCEPIGTNFNIIQAAKLKEYIYLFSSGEKFHPFSAPFMAHWNEALDIQKMQEGAKLFFGEHNFRKYCTQPSEKTQFIRKITHCSIEENSLLESSFFPNDSHLLRVKSKGFMRNQIRLIMGQLIQLGMGNIDLSKIQNSLEKPDNLPLNYIAPASGLMLHSIELDQV